MPRTRIQQLSIYLLKSHIAAPTAAMRDGVEVSQVALPPKLSDTLSLVVRSTEPHPPGWIKYFPVDTQESLQQVVSASSGAVLFVTAESHLFAVCFGTGWHLLKTDSYVRSFGLRVALSLIARNTLVAVDISTYDNFAKYRRVSTSKGTTIESFDIEGQLDLLRGVVGTCSRRAIAQQIGGRDPCVVWTHIPVESLPRLCSVLLRAYKSDRAERHYPMLTNVSLVKDPTDIARLDAALDDALAANPDHDLTLAPPEVVNWDDIHAFRIDDRRAPPPSVNLRFSMIRELLGSQPVSVAALRGIVVETVKPDGTPGLQHWSTYACVVTEIHDPQDTNAKCILMAGDWYVVAASYVQQVSVSLGGLPQHNARVLPDATATETEKQYNQRFVASDHRSLALLDTRTISYGGGRSRIEVCDILSADLCLYHIKDYHGSATLSHLFSQGTISARLLLEADFRSEVRRKFGSIVRSAIPDRGFAPPQYEIVFGIICEPTRNIPVNLPFFSKVRLLEAARELRRMGFTQVSTARISRR